MDLFRNDVARLRTFGALLNLEADARAFRQGLETGALKGTEMDEYVRAAVVLGDETKTFGLVKPFYCTCSHKLENLE